MQNIINRFTIQSFAIKGFSFSFLGLVYDTYYEVPSLVLGATLIVGVLIFWYLDSFYLKMEKIYREMEKKVKKEGIENINFNYSDDFYNGISKKNIFNVMFSKTILPLYFLQLVLVSIPLIQLL
jgi:hypothetical protein